MVSISIFLFYGFLEMPIATDKPIDCSFAWSIHSFRRRHHSLPYMCQAKRTHYQPRWPNNVWWAERWYVRKWRWGRITVTWSVNCESHHLAPLCWTASPVLHTSNIKWIWTSRLLSEIKPSSKIRLVCWGNQHRSCYFVLLYKLQTHTKPVIFTVNDD